jgi:uncharacterized protein with NRDE domain
MCLIALAFDCHPRYRLVMAANRDEYFVRPTAPARFWKDSPQLLAGRDLQSGGTWLGVTTTGRLAAVTNYREPQQIKHPRGSRGKLAADYLVGTMTPETYLETLRIEADDYQGFNLIVGDKDGLFHFSNRGGEASRITPGIHGLSNSLLNTPWPKVVAAREGLARLLRSNEPELEGLFQLLSDAAPFPDASLPDTGIGIERERLLSSLFIAGSDYGTRSSTIILIDRDDSVTFHEHSFNSRHQLSNSVVHTFRQQA